MNVSLTKELEQLVNNKVKTGRYLSASEVVREALRLLEDRDRLNEIRLADMRDAIRAGNDELARGQRVPGKQVFDELRARSRQRRAKG